MTNKERTANKKNLSRNLHKLLSNAHFSVRQAAKLCNIPLRTFESYYYGEKLPKEQNLLAIAHLFNMTPHALLSDDWSKASAYERQLYRDVNRMYDELTENTPVKIITDMLTQHIPCHRRFYKLCQYLEITIDYIPQYTDGFLKEVLYDYVDDIDEIDLVRQVTDSKLKDSKDLLIQRLTSNGLSEEEITKQIASTLNLTLSTHPKLVDLFYQDRNVYRSKALQYFADCCMNGDFDEMPLEEIPLRVIVNKREYNCKDLKVLETQYWDSIKDELLKKTF